MFAFKLGQRCVEGRIQVVAALVAAALLIVVTLDCDAASGYAAVLLLVAKALFFLGILLVIEIPPGALLIGQYRGFGLGKAQVTG